MGKKKGKGKGKGKKGGGGGAGADGLPPPPEFAQDREGAIEAMLAFQIKGKEDGIELISEETELYKDKNYQQSSKNSHVKDEKEGHMKRMLKEAKQIAEKLREAANISRSDVEKAMLDKLSIMKQLADEEQKLNLKISKMNDTLQAIHEKRDKLQHYREKTQYQNKEHIAKMIATVQKWQQEEEQLESVLMSELEAAKHRIDQHTLKMSEKQKERTSEWLMGAMNEDTKAEIADNLWMKEQIRHLRLMETNLKEEIDALEERNLSLMTEMYKGRKADLQAMCRIQQVAVDHSNVLDRRGSGSLPSLRSSTSRLQLATSETSILTQSVNIGLLSIEGARCPVRPPPQQLSLPPIEEQRNPSLVTSKTNWPITNRMLKSVV